MNYIRSLGNVMILIFLTFSATAQDPGNFLNPGDIASNTVVSPEIKNATAEDPLNPLQDLERRRHTGDNGKEYACKPGAIPAKGAAFEPI